MATIIAILLISIPTLVIGWLIIKACIKKINSESNSETKITAMIGIFLVCLLIITIISAAMGVPLGLAPVLIITIEIFVGWLMMAPLITSVKDPCEKDKTMAVIFIIVIIIALVGSIKFTCNYFQYMY